MKKLFFLLSFCLSYTLDAQNVKKLSELQLSGSIIHSANSSSISDKGNPYTGQVVKPYGKLDLLKLEFDGHYSNGKPNGKIQYWFPFPKHHLEYEENYKSGERDGTQKYYYENGKDSSAEFYSSGKRNGKQVEFYSTGGKKSERTYLMETPTGMWKEYYENGKLKTEEDYKQGQIISETSWYPNGNKLSEKNSGKWTTYDEQGQIKSVKTYLDGRLLKEEYFKDNIPDSVWVINDSEGNVRSITTKILYQNGKKSYEHKFLWNGIPVGVWIEHYNEEGKTKETNYNNEGEKISEGIKINQKKDGKWSFWSDHGKKITEETYRADSLLSTNTIFLYKLVKYPHPNSYFFKLSGENKFIRFDFLKYPTDNPYNYADIRVSQSIRVDLLSSDRLVEIKQDGPYKDETLDFIIELTDIDVKFDPVVLTNILTNQKTSGYSATTNISFTLKNIDGTVIDSKNYTYSTQHVLGSVAYQSGEQAFQALLTTGNKSGFVKKFIDKCFPLSKKKK